MFLPWRFCSEDSRVFDGMAMGPFQEPVVWGQLERSEGWCVRLAETGEWVRRGRFWELRGMERAPNDAEQEVALVEEYFRSNQ